MLLRDRTIAYNRAAFFTLNILVTQSLLQLTDLACERDGRTLFRALNLAVLPGHCVELTGPNGSGKSTLLRCITGLYPDYEGEIEVDSFHYLGHKAGISPLLTPAQNLQWYAGFDGAEVDVEKALERLGLAGYELVRCHHLSAGQQRRVSLARLLVTQADLWLLDEPFTALDSAGQNLVRELIGEHQQSGGAALCATHQALEIPDARALQLGKLA